MLKDNYTWNDFIAAMVVDLSIADVATAIGVTAGIGAAALTVGPIIVAVEICVGVGLVLGAID